MQNENKQTKSRFKQETKHILCPPQINYRSGYAGEHSALLPPDVIARI